MTIFEILNFNKELINRLRIAGIRLDDTLYIDLFADYRKLVNNGDKVSYAVAILANKYNISERKVYSILRRFKSECTFNAV